MAEDIAEDEQEQKGTSTLMVIVFLLVAALLAGGTGFAAGKMLFAPMIVSDGDAKGPATEKAEADETDADDGYGAGGEDGADGDDAAGGMRGPDFSALKVVSLDPITTNLGAPTDVWVRMELSLAVDPGEDGDGPDEATLEAVHADLLAYMRTTRLQALSMPSGFQHLVTDLETRAAMRTEGAVKRVFVKALLLE